MSYLVLARKARPQNFDEVVGQQTIVRTLQNALRQNRVPHGLMFSGIRGTGKTTLARIMAKGLNCEHGPTPEPCNRCTSCNEITAGQSLDLHEIDGASNRGIQEIRDLKEKIRFMPTRARFKIIIIDEVHMLTTEAFNALLKTLEEPPDHVYFIFATTELHKVPVTILSRCQRYELQRVGHQDLAQHFSRLARAEGIQIEQEAVDLIARESAGSVRDGLSLLDQVFSYCGKEVRAEEVTEVLGLVSHKVISDLGKALLSGNIAAAMELLVQIYGYGVSVKRFSNELLAWFRALILCNLVKEPERFLDVPEDDLARLSTTASMYSLQTLSAFFKVLLEGLEKANYSSQPRLAIEMAFIQAVQIGEIQPVNDLLTSLDKVLAGVSLEELVAEGSAGLNLNKNTLDTSSAGALIQEHASPSLSEQIASGAHEQVRSSVSDGDRVKPERSKPTAKPVAFREDILVQPSDTIQEPTEKSVGQHVDVRQYWPGFIDYVRDRKPWMAAALQRASTVFLEEEELVIQYDDSVDCNLLKNRDHVRLLTEFALDFFQQTLTLSFKVPEAGGCEVEATGMASPREARKALAQDPLVLAAIEIFSGQVGDIRVGPRFRTPLNSKGEEGEVDLDSVE